MGTCHGFEIESPLPFAYLRDGTGSLLRITEHDAAVNPVQPGPLLAEFRRRNQALTRVHQDTGRYNVWIEGVGWFIVETAVPTVGVPSFYDPAWRESILWGLPTALIVLERGELVFHASAIAIEGEALLLAAPGGHGKTTLAAAMMAAGHRLLSEDLIRCRLTPDPVVFPGPAMIRLRRDVVGRLPIPGTYQVAQDPEKVHLAVDPEFRGNGDPVPLRGLVFLHEGSARRLERVTELTVMPDLWAVTLNLPTSAGRTRCFEQISGLAATLPIWRLTRPITLESLPVVIDMLVSETASP